MKFIGHITKRRVGRKKRRHIRRAHIIRRLPPIEEVQRCGGWREWAQANGPVI